MSKTSIFIVILVVGLVGFFIYNSNRPGELDDFALCLKDKGLKFYGAFWCPHCQNQKKMFGRSERMLPYIECSTPDGKNQLQFCNDAGIKGYPTWEYPDGSRDEGEIPLDRLAEKSGCQLP